MNLSEPFIRRPVATTLIMAGIALAGFAGYLQLPVSPLPQVDTPTITVSASMAGASPEIMASTVATPLERHLGQIADVTEMTSQSSGDQRGPRRSAPGAAQQPHLPQGQPGRRPHPNSRAHLQNADAGRSL